MDLDVKMKAVMIGACFLIVSVSVLTTHQYLCSLQDFMFFERQQNNWEDFVFVIWLLCIVESVNLC